MQAGDYLSTSSFSSFQTRTACFAFNAVIIIYLQLDVVLLGFFTNPESVGYLVAATKLLMITMSISSALGAVIMPCVTNLLSEGKNEEFKVLIQKSYDFSIHHSAYVSSWYISLFSCIIDTSRLLGTYLLELSKI